MTVLIKILVVATMTICTILLVLSAAWLCAEITKELYVTRAKTTD